MSRQAYAGPKEESIVMGCILSEAGFGCIIRVTIYRKAFTLKVLTLTPFYIPAWLNIILYVVCVRVQTY